MSEFTKGDWEAKDWSSFGDWGVESGKSSICCAFGAKFSKENEANAHLIAAAPKMYRILQEVSEIRDLSMDDAIGWLIDNTDDILHLLAEARGEKSDTD